MSMKGKFDDILGTRVSYGGVEFQITEDGRVLGSDLSDLGHIEDCISEGDIFIELLDAISNIKIL